jgi:hypothetical protein
LNLSELVNDISKDLSENTERVINIIKEDIKMGVSSEKLSPDVFKIKCGKAVWPKSNIYGSETSFHAVSLGLA